MLRIALIMISSSLPVEARLSRGISAIGVSWRVLRAAWLPSKLEAPYQAAWRTNQCLAGSSKIDLLSDAHTVTIGRFTTCARRKCIATLHSR
jgi:hypothetical protein